MDELERAHSRLPMHSRVFIELEAPAAGSGRDSRILVCSTLDASPRGLQVAVAEELTEGAFLQIGVDVDITRGEETLYFVGQVCWCRPGDDPEKPWLAGFALLPAEESDLARWETLVAGLPGEGGT